MKKKNVVLFSIVVAIIIATTFIRYKNLMIDVPIFFSLCTIAAFILTKTGYASSKRVATTMVVSILLLYSMAFAIDNIPYYIEQGEELEFITVGTPNFIMAMAGIVCGAWLADSFNKKQAIVVSALVTAACLVFSIWYYRSLHLYWFNYLNNGTFTGKVTETVKDNSWYIVSQNNDTLRQSYYQDKIVLFDFWNTACGGCFKKFPDIERIYRHYKDHPDFVLNAVNIPIKRDTAGMAFTMMEKYNTTYSFPVFVADSTMSNTFDINGFPKVIIMKNNKIVFRGQVELAEDYLAKLLGD